MPKRVYTLPPLGESRGRVFSATARSCRQKLRQHLGRWPTCPASGGGLELQDALTKSLQGDESLFDTDDGLRQILLQESIEWLARRLGANCGEGLDRFESQPQGAQALDYLHTPQRFFPKQAGVVFASAPSAAKYHVLARS